MTHLEKITLRGYKSIRSLDEFPLNRGVNVMIGANGSGKTNFISFFSLLGYLMNGKLQSYVAKSGGADALLFRGMKVTPKMEAHLYFGRNEYRVELEAANDRSLFFAHESARFRGPTDGLTIYEQGVGYRESWIATVPKSNTPVQFARDTLSSWRVYHFHDTSPDAAVMGRCNTADNKLLHSDAGNVAAVLRRLANEEPDALFRIEEAVRLVAPFFSKFHFPDHPNEQTQLMWHDRHSPETLYSPYQLSDGTLRFICLTTLLVMPSRPAMVIIDEPELGLHPHAIDVLASMLAEASESTQLLLSTQSSRLLDHFSAREVIVANHREGETLLERLDGDQLAAWLEDYSLGELWEHERLGGTR